MAIERSVEASSEKSGRGFMAVMAAGLRALAARAGCTLRGNPMPELREVGHEWQRAAATRR
jgi:hypothetical protein